MKIIIFVIQLLVLSSCARNFSGIYQNGQNTLTLNKDQTFIYSFSHRVLGKGKIEGSWLRNLYSIYLKPTTRYKKCESSILIHENNSTFSKVKLCKVTYFNDTLENLNWLYKIDNETTFTETDTTGEFKIASLGTIKLHIKDWLHDRGYKWINIADSIFTLSLSKYSDITIFLADMEHDPYEGMLDKVLYRRKNKLYGGFGEMRHFFIKK